MTSRESSGIKLVPQDGIEPPHPAYKTGPLPLRIQGQKLVCVVGFEPTASSFQTRPSTRLTLHTDKHGGHMSESNRRHPACKTGVLPTELMAHIETLSIIAAMLAHSCFRLCQETDAVTANDLRHLLRRKCFYMAPRVRIELT